MKKISFFTLYLLLFQVFTTNAQVSYKFDKNEAMNLVAICNYWLNGKIENVDSTYIDSSYVLKYETKPNLLDNRWQLWENKQKNFAVINLRGTTRKDISWYENFYAAMIPAEGEMTLPGNKTVHYKYAGDKRASVHVGWAVSIQMMLDSIIWAINTENQKGIYNIYITGHSQGGALAHLLRAVLEYLPDSIVSHKNKYKVYAFAPPKPGNRFFAYDYASYTSLPVSSYSVINISDWVPQVPFSVQSPDNMVEKNPFASLENNDFKIPFLKRLVIKHVYFSMKRPIIRSQKRFEKYLGKKMKKEIEKKTGKFKTPDYSKDFAYFSVGLTIPLKPWKGNTDDELMKIFWQHLPAHYYYLIEKQL